MKAGELTKNQRFIVNSFNPEQVFNLEIDNSDNNIKVINHSNIGRKLVMTGLSIIAREVNPSTGEVNGNYCIFPVSTDVTLVE